MNIVQIDNWQEYQRDGEQFLAVASRAYEQKKKAFTPDTLYNLTCMGIEKLIMAFLMYNGDFAENHTMADLSRALEQHLGTDINLAGKMAYLDSFQEICEVESYSVRIPEEKDIPTILAIGEEIKNLIIPKLQN